MNPNNSNYFFTLAWFVLIILLTACIQESEPLDDLTKVSVKEAKAFYESNVDQNDASSARFENSIYDRKHMNWGNSHYRNRRNGRQALIIPISFEKDLFVVSSETGMKFPVENRVYGYVYRERNQIHFEIFHWVPTENNLNFTGYLLIQNLNGETLKLFFYEEWLFRSDHASVFGQTVPL